MQAKIESWTKLGLASNHRDSGRLTFSIDNILEKSVPPMRKHEKMSQRNGIGKESEIERGGRGKTCSPMGNVSPIRCLLGWNLR